jgi:hypothetical protein
MRAGQNKKKERVNNQIKSRLKQRAKPKGLKARTPLRKHNPLPKLEEQDELEEQKPRISSLDPFGLDNTSIICGNIKTSIMLSKYFNTYISLKLTNQSPRCYKTSKNIIEHSSYI